MAHFNLENELSNALRLDVPLGQGPIPRWQRKAMDASTPVNSSKSLGANNSLMFSVPKNKSTKTPDRSPRKNLDDQAKRLTPGRNNTPKSPSHQGDRFIPNRSAMKFDIGHYMLSKSNEQDENVSENSMQYRKTMNENLNGDLSNFRIMAYQKKAPDAPTGHANALKVLYSSKTPSSVKKSTRHIPQAAEKILDAPEILDDYYLNLIDWSCTDVLAVALYSNLYLWNASKGNVLQLMEMSNTEEYISSVSWLNDGNTLAVGTSTSEVQLWDAAAGKRIRSMKSHTERVSSLSWNSYILSSGSKSGAIHNHDVRVATHHVGTLTGHTQEVCGLKWSPDGRYLASGGNDNSLNVWQATTDISHNDSEPLHVFNEHHAAVKAVAWCPWQPNILASGGGTADRHIRFWNCNLGSNLNAIDAKSQVCAILWSKEYKELISGHGFAHNKLIIWKYPDMSKVCELSGHQSRILNLALSPDGTKVVSAGADETIRIWNCFAVDQEKKRIASLPVTQKNSLLRSNIR